jgi:hypothetical protein
VSFFHSITFLRAAMKNSQLISEAFVLLPVWKLCTCEFSTGLPGLETTHAILPWGYRFDGGVIEANSFMFRSDDEGSLQHRDRSPAGKAVLLQTPPNPANAGCRCTRCEEMPIENG